ncbi:MAG TPA: ester cyclase [Balneolales bacterium]|nr:ester cyclase [Balneolales bacterium]
MKKNILLKFIQQVWNEGNADAASEYIASTYTIYHDPGDPWDDMTLDLEGFKTRVLKLRAPIPDQYFEIQEIFEKDNCVAITWLWHGSHLREIADYPATGKRLRMSGATVYYFEGKHITGHWQITDRLSVYQQ